MGRKRHPRPQPGRVVRNLRQPAEGSRTGRATDHSQRGPRVTDALK